MSKRGNRRAAVRVRMAVAAAVLVGGGAAGVVAVSASHGGAATAESAGFSQSAGRTMSYSGAMAPAMSGWGRSPGNALMTISHMKPMTNSWTQTWHRTTIVLQRGKVLAVDRGVFVVQSANGTVDIWHGSRGTQVLNVGATGTGMSAMTGGTMRVPARWQMNTRVKGIARGDLVFVFGVRQNHTLKAQLVLFAAPAKVMPVPTATATTPAATPTATTPVVTPTATATQTMTATPAATTPVTTPTGTASSFSGTHS
jgi:hypothetical protein